jgi:hypothetical protein
VAHVREHSSVAVVGDLGDRPRVCGLDRRAGRFGRPPPRRHPAALGGVSERAPAGLPLTRRTAPPTSLTRPPSRSPPAAPRAHPRSGPRPLPCPDGPGRPGSDATAASTRVPSRAVAPTDRPPSSNRTSVHAKNR